MSVDYNVYVGPYLEYKVAVFVDKKLACEHEKTENPYCPKCGKNREQQYKFVKTMKNDPDIDWCEDFNEDFFKTNFYCDPPVENGYRTYLAIPNKGNFGNHLEFCSEEVRDLENLNTIEEKEKLETFFMETIEKLRKMCQHDNVSIKYGVICYAS